MTFLKLLSRPVAVFSAAPRSLPRLVRYQSTASNYENILVSSPRPGVGLSRWNSYWQEALPRALAYHRS